MASASVSALAGCPANSWDELKASDALGSLGRFRANGPIAAHQRVRCAGYLPELSRPAGTRKARSNRACPYPRTQLYSRLAGFAYSPAIRVRRPCRGKAKVIRVERASTDETECASPRSANGHPVDLRGTS